MTRTPPTLSPAARAELEAWENRRLSAEEFEARVRAPWTDRELDRSATVVEGHHDAYLRDKLGATMFKMWVDDHTGALMQLIGTSRRRRVLRVDRGSRSTSASDRSRLRPALPAGWTDAGTPPAP
jgi:hypothetical protein